MLIRVCFFNGMMYYGQPVQWYLTYHCNLLSLYKFHLRDELISFLIRINLWSSQVKEVLFRDKVVYCSNRRYCNDHCNPFVAYAVLYRNRLIKFSLMIKGENVHDQKT
jgi:hypothetical protein